MRKPLLVALAATTLLTSQAMAQDYGKTYVGIGLVGVELKTDASTTNTTGVSYKDTAPGGTVILGYDFTQNFALEGAITSTSRVRGTDTVAIIDPSGTINPAATTLNGDTDMRAVELVGKGTVPLGSFELYARGGLVWGDVDYDLNFTTVNGVGRSIPTKVTSSIQDTGIILGVGVGYRIGRAAIRLQYDYMGLDMNESVPVNFQVPDGQNFVQVPINVGLQTKDQQRYMLSISANF